MSSTLGWIALLRADAAQIAELDDQSRKLAQVLAQIRRMPDMAGTVDSLVKDQGMTIQWDILGPRV